MNGCWSWRPDNANNVIATTAASPEVRVRPFHLYFYGTEFQKSETHPPANSRKKGGMDCKLK
jgi:hypothetical protein